MNNLASTLLRSLFSFRDAEEAEMFKQILGSNNDMFKKPYLLLVNICFSSSIYTRWLNYEQQKLL